jgi:hypothetical protein
MVEALVSAFLRAEIDGRTFRHADHVRVAFALLRRHDFSDAAATYTSALKAIAAKAGNPGAYHETITLAFLALIAERSAASEARDYDSFARANPDLLDKGILARWYTSERLGSDIARKTFILPEPAR